MNEILLHEHDARVLMAQMKIERDISEPRSCAQIVIDLAMSDVDVAFDVLESGGLQHEV